MVALSQRAAGPSGLLALFACGIQAGLCHFAWAQTNRIEPTGSYVHAAPGTVAEATVLDVQEMAQSLRDAGVPVAMVAEMVGVERKTVYAWLDGGDARAAHAARLAEVHGVLMGSGVDLRALRRVAERPLSTGMTLRRILGAEIFDASAAVAALEELRPAVERHVKREANRSPARPGNTNPVLDEMPVADLG